MHTVDKFIMEADDDAMDIEDTTHETVTVVAKNSDTIDTIYENQQEHELKENQRFSEVHRH